MKIYSAGPYIFKDDANFIKNAYLNGWYDNFNYYHNITEEIIKKKFNIKHVSLFSSCTGALTVLLKSLNFKKGDEIIVPELTWIGTISGLIQLGLKPRFADVNIDDWTISKKSILKNINKKTKAIISVDLYGNPSEKYMLKKICSEYNLKFIEDAAPGIGSKYKGKFCGTFGDAGVFSFQGAKPITCGEGGAIITNNENLIDKINYYADHCRVKNKTLFSKDIGYKFKMSSLQAAMLYCQFKNFDRIINKRRKIFFLFEKYLKYKSDYFMNNNSSSVYNNFYLPSLVFKKKISIKKIQFFLKKNNIDTRPFFRPLSSLPMFKEKNNKNSYYIYKNGINLPSYSMMTEKEVKYVSSKVNRYLDENIY